MSPTTRSPHHSTGTSAIAPAPLGVEPEHGCSLPRGARRLVIAALLGLSLAACAKKPKHELPPENPKPFVEPPDGKAKEASPEEDLGPALPWAETTFSPRPGSAFEPEFDALIERCGSGDVALHQTATWVAEAHHRKSEVPNLDAVNFQLRRFGSPYVMPRLWSATMSGVSEEQLLEYVVDWLGKQKPLGEFRCGAGVFHAEDGSRTVSVLRADVLAELSPLPTKADANAWLDVNVRFLAPTTAVSIVLLPPEGAPRTMGAEVEMGNARARISLSSRGPWLVQVMATQEGGPRPVAVAMVTSGETPPSAPDSRPVPGEAAYDDKLAPADALFMLMNAARAKANLPLLERDRDLDRVALAHSKAMLDSGRISHDTGAGDPARRVALAGLTPRATGENVALAASVPRLHRVLWSSPSHRENLLLRRWDRAGVGIVRRDDGTLFATQLFSDVK